MKAYIQVRRQKAAAPGEKYSKIIVCEDVALVT